jgi:hypothetical protein
VGRFGRVHEHGRGAGRGQRCGDLAADVARFADPRDHHAAATGKQQADRLADAVIAAQAVLQGAHGIDLDLEGFPGHDHGTLGDVFVKSFQHCFFMGYTRG